MDINTLNNKIIISNNKEELIKYKLINPFLNFKIYSKNELFKKVFFSYDDKSLIYLYRLGYSFENSNEMLSSMYFLKKGISKKIDNLIEIKGKLESNNLLIKDDFFLSFIKNKSIILINQFNDKELKIIFNNLNIKPLIFNEINNVISNNIFSFNDINDEIRYIFEQISLLIKKDIPLNKIKIVTENKLYINQLKKYEHFYSFKFNINSNNNLYQTDDYKLFRSFIKTTTIDQAFSLTNDRVIHTKEFEKLFENYIKIKNYINEDEIISYFDYKAKNIKISNLKYENGIEICSLDKCQDDDYVLLIDFTLTNYPKIKKDNDYLNDNEKELLNINTSIDLQNIEEQILINKICSLKNLKISFSNFIDNNKQYVSTLSNKLSLSITNYTFTNTIYSKKHYYFYLSKIIDDYENYSFNSKYLNSISKEEINYLSYDNKFTNIPSFNITNLHLSASSFQTYNECGFKYYLSKILSLDSFEATLSTKLGNIAHKILENYIKNETTDLSEIKKDYNLTPYENIIIDSLKPLLDKMLENFINFKNNTKLKDFISEDSDYTYVINDNASLIGRIDLIINNNNKFAIIDFKTGDTKFDEKNAKFGLSNQLPIYYLLTKESNSQFKDKEFLGFYIHTLLDKNFYQNNFSYLLLNGITLSSEALSIINENFIKSVRNNYIIYNKDDFNQIIETTKNLINETTENILKGNFSINPKFIGASNKSCPYCKFKNICYKTYKDYIYLQDDKEIKK